jgi:hypothetical protein
MLVEPVKISDGGIQRPESSLVTKNQEQVRRCMKRVRKNITWATSRYYK